MNRWIQGTRGLAALLITLTGISGCGRPPQPPLPAPLAAAQAPPPPEPFTAYPAGLAYTSAGDVYALPGAGGEESLVLGAPNYEGMPAWTPDGSRIAYVMRTDRGEEIRVVDAGGDASAGISISAGSGAHTTPAWSPDGRRLAFAAFEGNAWGIFVADVAQTGAGLTPPPIRLTYNMLFTGHPAWSPDGRRLAYTTHQAYRWQIEVITFGEDPTLVTDQALLPEIQSWSNAAYPAWSPDGTRMAFASNQEGNWEIYTVTLGEGAIKRLTYDPAADWGPAWSPDGKWILFTSARSGNGDIYIVGEDGAGLARITGSATPESFPAWRRP